MADVFGVFLRDAGATEQLRPVTARVQVGTRFVFSDAGSNGLFSRSPATLTTQPIYCDVNLALNVAMTIAGMGAAARRGCAEAANAAAQRVRRKLVDIAQAEMTCTPTEAESVVSVTQTATESNPAAIITIGHKPIPLIQFNPVYETPIGVDATTRRSRGPDAYAQAFIAQSRGGADAVFRRDGSQRLPISELFGPSVRDVLNSELPQQQSAIELILYSELTKSANRIVNEDFGYATLGGLDEFLNRIA